MRRGIRFPKASAHTAPTVNRRFDPLNLSGNPVTQGLSKTRVPTGMDTVLYDSTAKSVNDQNVIDAIVNKHTVQLTPYYIYYKAYSIIRIKCRTQ